MFKRGWNPMPIINSSIHTSPGSLYGRNISVGIVEVSTNGEIFWVENVKSIEQISYPTYHFLVPTKLVFIFLFDQFSRGIINLLTFPPMVDWVSRNFSTININAGNPTDMASKKVKSGAHQLSNDISYPTNHFVVPINLLTFHVTIERSLVLSLF